MGAAGAAGAGGAGGATGSAGASGAVGAIDAGVGPGDWAYNGAARTEAPAISIAWNAPHLFIATPTPVSRNPVRAGNARL